MIDGPSMILPSVDLSPAAVQGGANYYDNSFFDGGLATYANGTLTMVANRQYATPIVLPAGSYDRMGVVYGTAGASGKKLRALLYTPNADARPGALLLDPGADLAADGSTGTFFEHTINLVLARTTLLVVSVWSDGTPVLGGWTVPGRAWYGEASGSISRQAMLYKDGGTFGTAPATFGTQTAFVASMVPRVRFRAT